MIAALLEGLPDDRRESLSLETVSKAKLTTVERWAVLTSFDRQWSPAFSAGAMQILSAQAANEPADIWRLSRAIEAASHRISPDAGEAFEAAVARSLPGTSMNSVTKHVDRVRLRADMQKEFRP